MFLKSQTDISYNFNCNTTNTVYTNSKRINHFAILYTTKYATKGIGLIIDNGMVRVLLAVIAPTGKRK